VLASRGGRTVIPKLLLLLLLPLLPLLLLLLLLPLLLATYSAGCRCGPVSDAESSRASFSVKAQDVAQKHNLQPMEAKSRNPAMAVRDRRSSGCAVQAGPYETNWQRRLWFGSRQLTSTAGADFTTPVDDLSRPTRHTVRSSDMNRRTLPKYVVSFSLGGTR
jgi:hypothetical protein